MRGEGGNFLEKRKNKGVETEKYMMSLRSSKQLYINGEESTRHVRKMVMTTTVCIT